MSCAATALYILNDRVVKVESRLLAASPEVTEFIDVPHDEIAIWDIKTFFRNRGGKLPAISARLSGLSACILPGS